MSRALARLISQWCNKCSREGLPSCQLVLKFIQCMTLECTVVLTRLRPLRVVCTCSWLWMFGSSAQAIGLHRVSTRACGYCAHCYTSNLCGMLVCVVCSVGEVMAIGRSFEEVIQKVQHPLFPTLLLFCLSLLQSFEIDVSGPLGHTLSG
jgi:hypothetical protein